MSTEKLIQALRRDKNDEEEPNHLAQMGKATLEKITHMNRGFIQPQLSQGRLLFL